jgi:hypothetical protein
LKKGGATKVNIYKVISTSFLMTTFTALRPHLSGGETASISKHPSPWAAWSDGAATSSQLSNRLRGYYRAKRPPAFDCLLLYTVRTTLYKNISSIETKP